MALLVLVSTLSISIEKHYCGEHLVDVSLFVEADKCGMEKSDEEMALWPIPGCTDVVDLIEGQDELNLEKTEILSASQKVFVLSFAYVFGGLSVPTLTDDPPFQHYTPPKSFKTYKF